MYVKGLAQILKMLALILSVFVNDERRGGNWFQRRVPGRY